MKKVALYGGKRGLRERNLFLPLRDKARGRFHEQSKPARFID
jgi:hypothetical protein